MFARHGALQIFGDAIATITKADTLMPLWEKYLWQKILGGKNNR